MENPWETIPLNDYENHMKLENIYQLQTMNHIMKEQFVRYPVRTVMILGVAGGNGLEHIEAGQFEKVYGIDINPKYLRQCQIRYPQLRGTLETVTVDLTADLTNLPSADLLIANLLIEYIGNTCFQQVVTHVSPQVVSCVIQANIRAGFVSDSPYMHVFDHLSQVYHEIQAQTLQEAMSEIGYEVCFADTNALPNGKKLIQLDFTR